MKVISKRKAHRIVSKWMHAYAKYIVGELEIWEFEKDCKDLAAWFRSVKEPDKTPRWSDGTPIRMFSCDR